MTNATNEAPKSTTPAPVAGALTQAVAAVAPKAKARPSKKVARPAAPRAKAPAKKTKAKKAAKRNADKRLVPADLTKYRITKDVKTAKGHPSVDCADEVATKLRGKTLDEVYAIAAKVLHESPKVLRAEYAHLNPGMQRMNLGNRMRKAD